MDRSRALRLVAVAATAGLVLRIAFGLLYWVDRPLTHDEREYLALAGSLSEGRGFAYDPSHRSGTAQQFGRAPAYPLFLAMIGAGGASHTESPTRVKVAQAFVGALGVWLIGVIALRAGGQGAGVAAATVAAIYPPLVWIPAYVFSETLYSTLALAVVLLLDEALRCAEGRRSHAGAIRAATAGLLAGGAVLVRPVMLVFLPLAAIWLLGRRRAWLAVTLVVAALAVVAPWTARNYRVYGRFVLVASEGGVTFWTGNHPLARGEGDLAANPRIKEAEIAFRSAHPGLTAEQLEPLYYRDAFRQIAAAPGWWLGLLARKLFYTIVPLGPSYSLHSMRYWAASLVSYLAVLLAALAGTRVLWKRRQLPSALLVLAASTVLVSLIFFPQERFRIPVIDPTLIVLAGAWLGRQPESR